MSAERVLFTHWDRYAPRLIYGTRLEWTPIAKATKYRVHVASPREELLRTEVKTPAFDLRPGWSELPFGRLDCFVEALDENGREVCFCSPVLSFHKAPGFGGERQTPLDWRGAVRRNIEYLLAPARDGLRDYERDLPRYIWSATEYGPTGVRWPQRIAYPALHFPIYIHAFLKFAQRLPHDPLAPDCRRHARLIGDWLLDHRQPADYACSLFPFSTIENGRYTGQVEGKAITLFRAAHVGEAMLLLHSTFSEPVYLAYARHLADVFVKLQRPDGSWPYRVDPQTAAVVEEYTSAAILPARLMRLLEALEPNPVYAAARERAERWVLAHPVRTHLWQGQYEDVTPQESYRNLQNWDTNAAIQYLLHDRRDAARHLQTAAALNEYIENLFVLWQREDGPVVQQCPTPVVLEQFVCYHPMECHTGNWILSLLALHQASGDNMYLSKAIAAANAIVLAQQDYGALSTWGHDVRFGRQVGDIWYGTNACGAVALLCIDDYLAALHDKRTPELDAFGI
jgi:hypothetical protein